MTTKIDILSLTIHGLMAFIGGVVKIITEKDQDKIFNISLPSFVAGGFVGIFAGLITFFICKHFEVGEYLSVALTGLAGYMGAPFLDLLSVVGKRLITSLFGYHLTEKDKLE